MTDSETDRLDQEGQTVEGAVISNGGCRHDWNRTAWGVGHLWKCACGGLFEKRDSSGGGEDIPVAWDHVAMVQERQQSSEARRELRYLYEQLYDQGQKRVFELFKEVFSLRRAEEQSQLTSHQLAACWREARNAVDSMPKPEKP